MVTTRHQLDEPPRRQVHGKGSAPHLAGTLPDRLPRRTAAETAAGLFGRGRADQPTGRGAFRR
ncbi:hypothetical protein [Micromonospora robiginosa]|uniref:Uncharacterized protein n=1 Tax=Micromonospora robiginosa TaxID=2749844 RepID=A0A7L6B316_9ACTN|nr:hypothetical protein [Micromonospora ferruginea]QLQ36276.1 hypothetical protein H1D33_23570 [Micromonospora ferruginea]